MSWVPANNKFSMAVGVAGAYVDVTSYVVFSEGSITRTVGRQSAFSDVGPGQFAFTLDNRDGTWTPDNPFSSLDTKLTEGVGVCWQLDSRLVSGRVRSLTPIFSEPGRPEIFRMRVVCDDMLGSAGRKEIDLLPKSIVMAASPFLYYPLNEAAGTSRAADQSGNNGPSLQGSASVTFGASQFPVLGETSASFGVAASGTLAPPTGSATVNAPVVSNQLPSISFWVSSPQLSDGWAVRATNDAGYVEVTPTASGAITANLVFTSPAVSAFAVSDVIFPSAGAFVSVRLSVTGTSYTMFLIVNGVAGPQISGGYTGTPPTFWSLSATVTGNAAPVGLAHLSLTKSVPAEELAAATSESARVKAIDATTPEVTLGTLPTDLSTTPLGISTGGSSALDMLNDVIRTEQGQIYTATSGTLLAPVQTVQVRARNRPAAVTASFSVATDIHASPDFRRDLNDSVSSATATGVGNSATATDASLIPKVGSANASIKVLYAYPSDTYSAASDRINRGKKRLVDIQSIRIDLRSGVDRSADILNLVPGNRYQIAGLPVAQLGYSTWDGWYIGHNETHTIDSSFFDLFFEPCTPSPGIYNTDRYSAGGLMKLASSLTAGATSMTVTTNTTLAPLAVTGAGTPYTLLIDKEQVTVTAATATTATITRGVNGTTAASHSSGALVDIANPAVYGY